jgi:ribose-phosphate pyrophosphokinase
MLYDTFGHALPLGKFPNGETDFTGVTNLSVFALSEITLKWKNDQDLFHLMMVKRSLGDMRVSLKILYMPYSRMDRDKDHTSKCSLRYAGEFIQSLNFTKIKVLDPHSDLTLAYLGEKAVGYYLFENLDTPQFADLNVTPENTVLMFPDAGAAKRYGSLNTFKKFPQVIGNKLRDFQTGQIQGYQVTNAEVVTGKTVIIVDDLCSQGTTFKFAANELKKFNPAKIILLVSHCEDTILKGNLLKDDSNVNLVITTDSIFNGQHPKMRILNLLEEQA